MDSFGPCSNFQDRINRMNAWKRENERENEEFIRKQKIRMFINDCDEIRPNLRKHLLIDSKLCQLEQMKDQQKRQEMVNDFEEAWNEVRARSNQDRCERERFVAKCRLREGLSIQDFQKQQMSDKIEQSLKVYKELNEERKQFEKMGLEDYEKNQENFRVKLEGKKRICSAIKQQIHQNYESRKQQLEEELKMDQIINEKVRRELERQKIAEKDDRDQFRRDVDLSNHNLMMAREHNDNIEKRKEKLIDDIQINALEESWRQRCEFKKKRDLVNHIARKGQVEQIQRRETEMIKEKRQQKQENLLFNEHESSERQKLRENSWQHRLKCYHHGRELLEQTKAEELRDAAEKQKLNETLMLVAQERARCETSGLEFVKSCQDVLPLHPNLLIIQKGKKN